MSQTTTRRVRRAAAASAPKEIASARPTAVVYARFSDQKQNEMSVADQLKLCREAAERAGYEVVGEYHDKASTGRTLLRSRPGIMAMKEHVERGGVNAVFVEGVERIGRRAADVMTTATTFEHLGVALYSANAGLIDWKMVPFYAGIADIQSREIGEKTRRGQMGKTERGAVAAGISYGYRVVASKDLNREINADEALVVMRIFAEYAAGMSPRAIAAGLNADGIPSPRGGKWNDSTIRGNAKKRDGMLRNEAFIGIIVYGRNTFSRDPETGNRISRPGDEERIMYCDRPELQIVDDETWNTVQDRLEATYAKYTKEEPDARSLNGSHRAKYLLSRLITCDCCGAGYTIIGKDRYGCYGRKTRGHQECSNAKTISRFRLEDRVLARLRQGLLTPELTAHFKSEVERLLQEEADNAAQKDLTLEADLARVQKAITNLLDILESKVASQALVARLSAKEEEAREIEAAIADRDRAVPRKPEMNEINPERLYGGLLMRLDQLLSCRTEIVTANELIAQLISEIRVRPDENARDGLAVEIHGDLGRLVVAGGQNDESAPGGAFSCLSQISVVAGVGFEPTTFRL